MSEQIEKLLSGYDSEIVKTMEFLIYDMTQFLEEEIDRDELEGRIEYAVNKFERIVNSSR